MREQSEIGIRFLVNIGRNRDVKPIHFKRLEPVIPAGWRGRLDDHARRPDWPERLRSNIIVTREPSYGLDSIEVFAEEQKSAMQTEVGQLEVLDERPLLLNGSPAFSAYTALT